MPEPWVEVKTLVTSGSGFCRLLPTTTVDGVIQSVGSNSIDLLIVKEEAAKFPDLTPKLEEVTIETSTETVIKRARRKVFIDGLTGYKTGETVEYSFEIKAEIGKTKYDAITSSIANPFFAVIGRGYNVDQQHLGFYYILGYVSGLEYKPSTNGLEVSMTIKGGFSHKLGAGVNLSAINTKLATSIEAVGKAPVTITALTQEDLDKLLVGQIVAKD